MVVELFLSLLLDDFLSNHLRVTTDYFHKIQPVCFFA
jgi:hypothetical protein